MNTASRANLVQKFQNVKVLLHKTILHIKFNKSCLENNVIPNYAIIRLKGSSIAESKTKKYAEIYRVKEEIKSQYIKSQTLIIHYTNYIYNY